MITNKELDRLQALCDGATAGPWVRIAAARTALPALIGEVRRLQERCEAAERDLELHGGCPSCAAQTGGGRVPCGFFALDTSVPRARCRNYSWRGPQPAKEDT